MQSTSGTSSWNFQSKLTGMDSLVLIDALAVIMGHEEKELCKPGHLVSNEQRKKDPLFTGHFFFRLWY